MTTGEAKKLPSPLAAFLIFIAVLVSNLSLGQLFATAHVDEDWLLVATPLGVLFWTVLAVVWLRVDARETLLLRLPSWPDVLMAIPLALSFVVLSDQLSSLTEAVVRGFPKPLSDEIQNLLRQVKEAQFRLLQASRPSEWLAKVSTVGIGAAVSEELLFRGFIQSGFGRALKRTFTVIVTSFLFMAVHILPLPAFFAAGLVLGFTALATRSIVVPMVVHLLNNSAALALVNFGEVDTLSGPIWIPAEILIPAIAIFALTMTFYARRLMAENPASHRSYPTPLPPNRDERDDYVGKGPPSFSEELASVPPKRRRLGWLVVLLAVLVGTAVLVGLFAYSLYMTHPQQVQATMIEVLSEESRALLDSSARGREGELGEAFKALSAVNETGSLSFKQLFRVARSYAEASADGSIDEDEVGSLIDAIREAVGVAASPRRL